MDSAKPELSGENVTSPHLHFAGRQPAGSTYAITLAKNGARHIRRMPNGEEKETLSIGLACSECFSGPRLAQLLKPGFDYEKKAMEDMLSGSFASTLSIHTSSGVTPALTDFVDALEPHLPWKNQESLDWCVSLQIEGASAVWAAIDMLLQVNILTTGNKHRKMVAVGATSYHGPPSTSFGARSPLWHKNYQVQYPVPSPGTVIDSSKLLGEFESFLKKHGDEVGVLLVEPQWGSSTAGFPWPQDLLKQYIKMAQARGILVVADEIMCGMGRHGEGTLFLSEAWDLNPDAVTFGKAIAAGVYPLSGAILKKGRNVLGGNGRSVMQSHTFAGASTRAFMTGTAVLNELPKWMPNVSKLGEEMKHIFRYLEVISDGMVITHGQGLMWGCLFSHEGMHKDEDVFRSTIECYKKHCDDVGVLPYFVPVGGFTVTPVMDIDVGTLYEIGQKLVEAMQRTVNEVGWQSDEVKSAMSEDVSIKALPDLTSNNLKCLTQHHVAKSCTSCTNFVCRDVRMRFLHFK